MKAYELLEHYVKSDRVWSYSGLHFSTFGFVRKNMEYLSVFSPVRENGNQNNSGY